jgi:hypothetical protein
MGRAYNCFSVPASGQNHAGGGVSFLFHPVEIKPANGGTGEKNSCATEKP